MAHEASSFTAARKSGWLKYLLHFAVLVGLAVAAVKYIDGEEFTLALRSFHFLYLLPILGLTVSYLLLKAWRFYRLLQPAAQVRPALAFRLYVAGQAMTVLPGGVAARAGLFKQVGVPVSASSVPIALSSLLDQAVFILGSLIAALWFEAARQTLLIVLSVLVGLSVLLGVQASRRWLAKLTEALMDRMKLLAKWRDFLAALKEVAHAKILAFALGLTVAAFVLNVESLDLATRGLGAAVPYPTLLLAFVLPTMLGRISALPAGVGVTEAAMVSILSTAPSIGFSQAAAAVAVFRVGTVFFAALLGGIVYALGWFLDRRRR